MRLLLWDYMLSMELGLRWRLGEGWGGEGCRVSFLREMKEKSSERTRCVDIRKKVPDIFFSYVLGLHQKTGQPFWNPEVRPGKFFFPCLTRRSFWQKHFGENRKRKAKRCHSDSQVPDALKGSGNPKGFEPLHKSAIVNVLKFEPSSLCFPLGSGLIASTGGLSVGRGWQPILYGNIVEGRRHTSSKLANIYSWRDHYPVWRIVVSSTQTYLELCQYVNLECWPLAPLPLSVIRWECRPVEMNVCPRWLRAIADGRRRCTERERQSFTDTM